MRVLIIGLGSVAQKHVYALNCLNIHVDIYALRSDPNCVKHENVTNVFSLTQLGFIPDFIIISNPTVEHYSTIKEVLYFGCPLFIEKPSVASLDQANELLELIENKKIITYIGCNLRFLPCIQFVKEHLTKQNKQVRVNEVNIYYGSYLPKWRPTRDFRMTYSAHKDQGGGVHLDLIHEIDYLYWLFGDPLVVLKSLKSKSSLQISAIDYANYIIEYDTFSASVILNYYRRSAKRTFEILFENTTWEVDLLKNTISSDDSGLLFNSEVTLKDTYILQMQYFIQCIEQKKSTMNDFKHSLRVLSICLNE